MSTNTETLHFKIGLSGTSDKKSPEFVIKVNGTLQKAGKLLVPAKEVEYFEFEVECPEGDNLLEIDFLNKAPTDTVVVDGKIVEDMLLCIESIEIDDIDLGALLWTNSIYRPVYPDSYNDEAQKQVKEIKNSRDLGWNGTWVFPFTGPFYVWLLENI